MNKRKEEKIENDEEEEEEDYMSNEFLNQLVDTRPGLVSRSVARKYDAEKKSKQKIGENNLKNLQTSSKALEKLNRDEALSKSTLDESNKGFNLMLKMGYKKGEALGSQETKVSAPRLVEPIKVELKSDRSGLGQVDERKRKLDEYQQAKQVSQQTSKQIEDAYRETKRHRFLVKKLRSSLFKCQKICYQLDSMVKGLHKPDAAKWFWPPNIIREIYKKESEQKTEPKIEQIDHEIVVESEESEMELNGNRANESNCKTIDLKAVYEERLDLFLKNEEYSNKKSSEPKSEEETTTDDEEEERRFATSSCALVENENSDTEPNEEDEELDEEEITKRVDAICTYLRENYNYCVWCGYRYESSEDLITNCPGLTQNEHEDYE